MKTIKEKCEEFAKEHMTGEYAAYDLEKFVNGVLGDECQELIERLDRQSDKMCRIKNILDRDE